MMFNNSLSPVRFQNGIHLLFLSLYKRIQRSESEVFGLVSATEVPGVVRVIFPANAGVEKQGEVVCFVRVEDMRLGIYYSHHVWRHRATPTSAWENEQMIRVQMTPQLEAQIMFNVPNELWSSLVKGIKIFPGDVNSKLSLLWGKGTA